MGSEVDVRIKKGVKGVVGLIRVIKNEITGSERPKVKLIAL